MRWGARLDAGAVCGRPDVGIVADVAAEGLGVQVLWDEVAARPLRERSRQLLRRLAAQRARLQLRARSPTAVSIFLMHLQLICFTIKVISSCGALLPSVHACSSA